MKTYIDRSGNKTITRASAMILLAACAAANQPIPAALREHPNYHVRRAVWLADDAPIPSTVEGKLALLKSVQPNLFAAAARFKGKDLAEVAKRADEIKKAEEHNAKAVLLRAAEPEKLGVLLAWLPIVQRELSKLPSVGKQDEIDRYKTVAALCAEVDSWLRERDLKYIPEPITPTHGDDYSVILCPTNSVGIALLTSEVVDALAAS